MVSDVFDVTAYYSAPGVQAAELPLRGGQLSMVFILPDPGTFDSYFAALDAPELAEVLAGLQPHNLNLGVPRFAFANAFTLRSALQAMGMIESFELGVADFSGMAGGSLFISDVFHNTFVGVDQNGVEAATASGIVINDTTGGPSADTDFIADRPFLFAIRDLGTDSLLWFGRVLDPTAM